MKKGFFFGLIAAVLGTAMIFTACNKKDDTTPPDKSQMASVSFYLTDDPASYDAVYIDIQQVEVTMEGSAAVALTPVMAETAGRNTESYLMIIYKRPKN